MKQKEIQAKVKEINAKLELQTYEKLRAMELDMDLENRESNRNRARSVTVGTAFGGTTEIMMRSDGGRHIWCAMQPVEVIELIHQLAANVGCNLTLKPRDDFSSWRDWRVSEAEKKHLNGHPPFVNDMAVFQQLGASGYNDEEAKKIMDILANTKKFANENVTDAIVGQQKDVQGCPSVMVSEESGLVVNKLAMDEQDNIVYTSGGTGGAGAKGDFLEGHSNGENSVAAKKTVNKRTTERTARTS